MRNDYEVTPESMEMKDIPMDGHRSYPSWFQNLKRPNGKVHLPACSVLMHVVYHLTDNYTFFCSLHSVPFDPYQIGICEVMGLSQKQVRDGISFLDGRGILRPQAQISPSEAAQILRAKKPQTFDCGLALCLWCGCRTMKLQAHHYPVTSKDGGTETVTLCANCHYEYHALVDGCGYYLDADEFEKITYEIDRGEG